jgi:predicted SprT family Zn-dependent metalloprotease
MKSLHSILCWLDKYKVTDKETDVGIEELCIDDLNHSIFSDDVIGNKNQKALGRDSVLEQKCIQWIKNLGIEGVPQDIQVRWNSRMTTTAGYARFPAFVIDLNPYLKKYEEEVERTLKHELAHLLALARYGVKIEAHGAEWKYYCARLGISDETVRHRLQLGERRQVEKKYTYRCMNCKVEVKRVRKFKRYTACLSCCQKYNGGKYSSLYQFQLVTV